MSAVERLLDRWLEKRVIVNCGRDTYLHRWYLLRGSRVAIFVHKFVRSDEDRALHDHPWNFIVVPIWRGYREHYESPRSSGEVYEGIRRVRPILGTRFRRGTYRHRVQLLRKWPPRERDIVFNPRTHKYEARELPSWSLFIRFREFREWGFWTSAGWIQWNRWWQDKCE